MVFGCRKRCSQALQIIKNFLRFVHAILWSFSTRFGASWLHWLKNKLRIVLGLWIQLEQKTNLKANNFSNPRVLSDFLLFFTMCWKQVFHFIFSQPLIPQYDPVLGPFISKRKEERGMVANRRQNVKLNNCLEGPNHLLSPTVALGLLNPIQQFDCTYTSHSTGSSFHTFSSISSASYLATSCRTRLPCRTANKRAVFLQSCANNDPTTYSN